MTNIIASLQATSNVLLSYCILISIQDCLKKEQRFEKGFGMKFTLSWVLLHYKTQRYAKRKNRLRRFQYG